MQTVSSINQVFLNNMAQLWRRDPKLAQRIDEVPPDASLEVQPSRKGPPTASVTTDDGRKLFLHSRYDPETEALEFCGSLERTEAFCVVLAGFGLGYHLKALIETFGEEIVIVVSEPDLVTIKTAFEHTDFSKELGLGHVVILTEMGKQTLHQGLGHHSTMLMLGTFFAVPPVARDHNAEFHTQCRQAVMDYAAFAKMSLLTLVRNAGITCRNISNNLPTYVSTPPADILRGRFAGCPAILVAAGPSLAKNVDQLRGLQDKAVIIAAQTTLRLLLSHGIRPHFVTSLDFSEMSRQFFENVDIPDNLVLVAEPKASWHVIDTFRGSPAMAGNRVILLDNEFAHQCVGDALGKRTPIEAGATVMHLAFYLAQWLGCDPIVFIGQDLGFGGHCYYAPGVAMHRSWWSEMGRFSTLEMKEWTRIVRHREILRKVKDIHGGEIYTDEQMFTYLVQFERDFAKCAAKIIDATEGGAKKTGANVMTLADVADQYCREPMDAGRFDYLRGGWYDATRLGPAREALVSRREELTAFRGLCEKTKEVLDELTGLVGDPKRFNNRIVRVDELRTLVQRHEVIFRMVRDVSQLGELQKFAADRRLSMDFGGRQREPAKAAARAKQQIQRDIRLIESLLDGCDYLEETLDQTLARLDKAREAS